MVKLVTLKWYTEVIEQSGYWSRAASYNLLQHIVPFVMSTRPIVVQFNVLSVQESFCQQNKSQRKYIYMKATSCVCFCGCEGVRMVLGVRHTDML